MTLSLKEESGLTVLCRLCPRPCLDSLLPSVFPPPLPQVTRVTWSGHLGDSHPVTCLITDLLVTCLLPRSYKDVSLGGCGADILLINTEHHVKVNDIENVLECRVRHVSESHYRTLPREARTRDKRITSTDQWNIVKTSLERLHVMDVFSPDNMEVSLLSIQDIVVGNENIAAVFVDSVSAFYQQERGVTNVNYNSYIRRLLCLVTNSVKKTNNQVKVVYTQNNYFTDGGEDRLAYFDIDSRGLVKWR